MEFVELLRSLQSNDNAARNAAEKRFGEAKKSQAAATIASLFQVLAEPQVEDPVREQAAVLLRQCLAGASDASSIWHAQLDDAARADVKDKLLQLLEAEPKPMVRRKIADAVQVLGNQLIDLGPTERPKNIVAWPELMPALMRVITDGSKDGGVRADALWAVKELTGSLWQVLLGSGEQTMQVLKLCLSDTAEGVRANAASLLCEFIDQIEQKAERAPFTPLVQDLAAAVQSLAASSDAKLLNSVLQSMQTTAETADFFKDFIGQAFMPLLCTIARSQKEADTRRLALEVIISYAENKPKFVAKLPGYLQQTVEVCTHFVMELDDDVEAWAADDDDDAESEEQVIAGLEALDRLCGNLHKVDLFPAVLEVLKPVMAQLFQQPGWKQVGAGIAIMSSIAEYVEDEELLTQMITAVKAQLKASHVRVRYAAWSAMAQLAVDHPDVVTGEQWVSQLLPEFLAGLDDPCQRVMTASMEAFQHYGESVEREDLEPFVQPLMEKIGQRLQGPLPVQKKAITFIAVIAAQVEDGFAAYYGALMPILKSVIQSSLHKTEERTLLGKTFECISLLAESVGAQAFAADAEIIMQAMIQAVQVPNLPSNDPVKEYMLAASERLCHTLKGGFLPFVPHILPGILEKLSLAPKEYTGEDTEGIEGEMNLTMTRVDGEVKVLIMSTSDTEDLQHAIEAVRTFVEELGKLYAPFVPQTAQALLPVFDFSMNEEIRDIAFDTWGQLCHSARESGQPAILADLCQEFMKRILPQLDAAEIDTEALKTRADGCATCLKKAGPNILSVEQVSGIVQIVTKVLGESFERREQSEKDVKSGKADEGENEAEDENGLRLGLAEIAGALMQHHPELFMSQGLDKFLPMVQKLIVPTARTEDRKLALCVACDMLEHLGARISPRWPEFLPALLQDIANPAPEVRQPACYGASLAARDPAFAPLALETASKLGEMVAQTRARPKKKSEKPAQACADNALSALLEILTTHAGAVAQGSAGLWGVWVAALPCQEDEQEGVKNHKALLKMVQAEKAEVVGQAGANLSQVLAVLVDVYKTEMADDETSADIRQLVLKIPQAMLETYAAGFKEKQQKKLLRIHRDAQSA